MKKIFVLTMLITFLSAGCLAEQNDPWDNALNIDETHVILSDEEKKRFLVICADMILRDEQSALHISLEDYLSHNQNLNEYNIYHVLPTEQDFAHIDAMQIACAYLEREGYVLAEMWPYYDVSTVLWGNRLDEQKMWQFVLIPSRMENPNAKYRWSYQIYVSATTGNVTGLHGWWIAVG